MNAPVINAKAKTYNKCISLYHMEYIQLWDLESFKKLEKLQEKFAVRNAMYNCMPKYKDFQKWCDQNKILTTTDIRLHEEFIKMYEDFEHCPSSVSKEKTYPYPLPLPLKRRYLELKNK